MIRTHLPDVDRNPPPTHKIDRIRSEQLCNLLRWHARQVAIAIDRRAMRELYQILAGRQRINSRRPRR